MAEYTVEIHYLDVGQGDCSIIVVKDLDKPETITNGKDDQIVRTVLIDCGSDDKPGSNTINLNPANILVLELQRLNIEKIDIVIISHFDSDHFNGIVKLLETTSASIIDQAKFYDLGCIYTHYKSGGSYKPHITEDINAQAKLSWYENYYSYVSLLEQLNTIHKFKIQRPTERVYCGWPDYFSKGSSKQDVQPENREPIQLKVKTSEWFPLSKGEPEDVLDEEVTKVNFEACTFLLGKDLMNDGYEEKDKIPVHLWCLTANGWIHDPTTKENFNAGTKVDQKNNFSLGILFNFNKFAAWFGGDLTSEVENQLEECIKFYSPHGLNILKAAHHGSENSTDTPFLDALTPPLVIITCGENAKHSHPSIATIQRLANAESVKSVVVTGFDVKIKDPKTKENRSYKERLQEYVDVGFPADYRDPYNPNGLFFVAGSTWVSELSHIFVSQIYTTKNETRFSYSFFTAFESLLVTPELKMDVDEEPFIVPNIEVNTILNFKGEDLEENLRFELGYESETEEEFLKVTSVRKRKHSDVDTQEDPRLVKKMNVQTQGARVYRYSKKPF